MPFSQGPHWSHGGGQSWTTRWTPELVVAAPDPLIGYATYIEQILGVGFPTKKDLIVLRKRVNEIFQHYPQANWFTMCRLVSWLKKKKRKFVRVYCVVDNFREAMAAGALPELTAGATGELRDYIYKLLETETDPVWRKRFLACPDDVSRRAVLERYRNRGPAA